jgi:hypothetical protein
LPCDWSKAGYSSFDDCVAQNQDKGDPGAYCASIMRQIGGEKREAKMANLCGKCNWIVDDPAEVLEVCPLCGAKAYYVPVLHGKTEGFAGTMRHKDFVRIHGEFARYYCQDQLTCAEADKQYYSWLRDLKLDETKPYGEAKESFSFVKDMIKKWKEDEKNIYYKVLVGFPTRSMNDNVYGQGDLIAMAHSLVGVPINMNHHQSLTMQGPDFVAAQFEDGAVEGVLKVPRSTICPICGGDKPLHQLIDEKGIVNVSLEADSRPFRFTGCALLTTDVLPGIPMARIFPMEKYLSEALSASKTLKGKSLKIDVVGIKMTKKREDVQPLCPDGQERDETGLCVPKAPPSENPKGTDVAQGTPAADDTSTKSVEACSHLNPDGTFIGGFQGCMDHMMTCKGLPEENAKKLCAFIGRAAGKIASFTKEQRDILIEIISDAMKEDLIPASERALEISTLQVQKLQAEKRANDTELQCAAKLKGIEVSLAETNELLKKESLARQKAEGRIIELENRNKQLEKQQEDAVKQKIDDGDRIKEWQRKAQDRSDELVALKTKHEKLEHDYAEVDEKYRVALQKNLEFSKRLTDANEQFLAETKRNEQLEAENKKHKRLAKIIVKT